MEEQAQNQLIARLINGKEVRVLERSSRAANLNPFIQQKRLREEKAISDALRNAVQLIES